MTLDGLIFHMHGPEVRRRDDITLYHKSGTNKILLDCLFHEDKQLHFYGDSNYMLRPWLQVRSNRAFASPAKI